MYDHPDKRRKEILCELIDQLDGDIQNDWTGEMMTKTHGPIRKEYSGIYPFTDGVNTYTSSCEVLLGGSEQRRK